MDSDDLLELIAVAIRDGLTEVAEAIDRKPQSWDKTSGALDMVPVYACKIGTGLSADERDVAELAARAIERRAERSKPSSPHVSATVEPVPGMEREYAAVRANHGRGGQCVTLTPDAARAVGMALLAWSNVAQADDEPGDGEARQGGG